MILKQVSIPLHSEKQQRRVSVDQVDGAWALAVSIAVMSETPVRLIDVSAMMSSYPDTRTTPDGSNEFSEVVETLTT